MRFRVVPNGMASRNRFFYKVGTLAHKTSDQEESGFRIVAVQKIEKFWRDRWIRPVVKRKGQFARRMRAPDRVSENLRPRINRAVGGNSRRSEQRCSRRFNEPGIHAPILARKEAPCSNRRGTIVRAPPADDVQDSGWQSTPCLQVCEQPVNLGVSVEPSEALDGVVRKELDFRAGDCFRVVYAVFQTVERGT